MTRSLVLLALLAAPTAGDRPDPAGDTVAWTETARDVFVDGVHDPAARTLTSREPARLAVLASGAEQAWIVALDGERGDGGQGDVSTLPRDAFAAGDNGGDATSPPPRPGAGSHLRVPGDGGTLDLLEVDGTSVVVAPHQGPVGALSVAELWRLRPTWRARKDAYEADPAVVAALAAADRAATVTIYLGTWCGDSRNGVPGLLAALERADNPALEVELVAIGRGFTRPLETIRENRLTNVPTVVVRAAGEGEGDGAELGRLVETPAGASLEADLAALLAGAPTPHPGALTRTATLAEGRYRYLDAHDVEIASERFALYRTTNDRLLLHCRRQQGDLSVDAWQRFDATGLTDFLEVTRSRQTGTEDEEIARTRLWIDGGDGEGEGDGTRAVSATTRGTPSGIVRQALSLPDGAVVVSPCTLAAGRPWARHRDRLEASRIPVLVVPTEGASAATVVPMTVGADRAAGTSTVAGRPARRVGIDDAEWWLERDTGHVLGGRLADGTRVVLEALETFYGP